MATELSLDGEKIAWASLLNEAKNSKWCASIWRAMDKVESDQDGYIDIDKLLKASCGTWGHVAIREIIYDFKYSDISVPKSHKDRLALLEQRTMDELSIFQDRQELQPPRKIVEAAYEIVSKQDIEMSLHDNDFSDEALGVLLREHHLLDTLYERWLKWDDSGMEALSYCINRYVQDSLQVEATRFACKIGENYFAISATDEGYEFNFYDGDYGLLDGGVINKSLVRATDNMKNVIPEIGQAWALINGALMLTNYKSLPYVDYSDLKEKVAEAEDMSCIAWKQKKYAQEIAAPDVRLTGDSEGISVEGFIGTWYVIDVVERDGKSYYLLEHEEHGDDADSIFVDKEGTLVLDCARNGAEDLDYFLESENDDLEPDC